MTLAVRDLYPLFVLLALVGFGVAIWLAVRAAYLGALCAAIVAVLILVYAT